MKKYGTLRSNRYSFLVDRKVVWVTLMLALATLAVAILSTGLGEMKISPLEVVKTFFGVGDPANSLVVLTFRLPRIVLAVLVGMALAVSGAILQGIIRNPLASPDVIGITGGASVAAVTFITYLSTLSIHWLPLFAFLGAMVITVLLYAMAWKNGVAPLRLVLVGVGIGASMSAFTTLLLVTSPLFLTSKAITWLTGSIYGATWTNVFTLLPWVLVLLPTTFVLARYVNVQQLGDDVATSVGGRVQVQRIILLALCAALAGAAVAVGGAIGFVGLLAPHIARQLVGPSFGGLLPVAALVGALIVLLADLIGRIAFAPLDLPVGIFTAGIGAPFFIYLLYRNRNQ